jgi:hypothetical protein
VLSNVFLHSYQPGYVSPPNPIYKLSQLAEKRVSVDQLTADGNPILANVLRRWHYRKFFLRGGAYEAIVTKRCV